MSTDRRLTGKSDRPNRKRRNQYAFYVYMSINLTKPLTDLFHEKFVNINLQVPPENAR